MSIVGIGPAKAALAKLLSDSKAAVEAAQTTAARAAAANGFAESLVDYANDIDPETPDEADAIQALRTLAIKTAHDLEVIAIGAPVTAIDKRAAELAQIVATLDHDALANARIGDRLQLKPLSQAIGSIGDGIAAARAMVKTLDGTKPDEASILAALKDLSARYTDLQAALARLGA